MKTILVSVCASVCPNFARKTIQHRAEEAISTFFSITSPVLVGVRLGLAESSEQADSEYILVFFKFHF